jgi:hypothetical protein
MFITFLHIHKYIAILNSLERIRRHFTPIATNCLKLVVNRLEIIKLCNAVSHSRPI